MFSKPPVPGRVKTRLIGDLSAEQACELHTAMVEDLAEELLPGAYETIFVWATENAEEMPTSWPRADLKSWRQSGANLGERLQEALVRAQRRFTAVCVVGADHPGLSREQVEEAFTRLETDSQVVLGPASDGGYYLVGLRCDVAAEPLFRDIRWSTESVFSETVARCEKSGLALGRLRLGHDVDTPEDLEHLQERLERGEIRSPAVGALLHSWTRGPKRASAS